MAIEVILPALSAGMEEGVIAKWLVAPGDQVKRGQTLVEVETDKATMELEAAGDGIIGTLLVAEGVRALVGQPLTHLLAPGESPSAAAPSAPAPAQAPAITAAPVPSVAAPEAAPEIGRRLRISPLARRLARAGNLSLEGLAGSGPNGRIVRLDVERALAQPQAAAAPQAPPAPTAQPEIPGGIGPYEAQPHSSMRRTIARRLTESKQFVPHFYLQADADIADLLALRRQINERPNADARVSINDLIIKACARALERCPQARVIWTPEALLQLDHVDIAVAVATDGGLITPILRQANRMALGSLSAEMKRLAGKARDNKLRPEEFQGGCFSVSNLGMYGVDRFSAIINPPQSAILAVGQASRKAVERDGGVAFTDQLALTLSVDHRAIDGAVAAQLLAEIKAGLEDPMSLLL